MPQRRDSKSSLKKILFLRSSFPLSYSYENAFSMECGNILPEIYNQTCLNPFYLQEDMGEPWAVLLYLVFNVSSDIFKCGGMPTLPWNAETSTDCRCLHWISRRRNYVLEYFSLTELHYGSEIGMYVTVGFLGWNSAMHVNLLNCSAGTVV